MASTCRPSALARRLVVSPAGVGPDELRCFLGDWLLAPSTVADHYRELDRRWHNWGAVADACRRVAVGVLDRVAGEGSA